MEQRNFFEAIDDLLSVYPLGTLNVRVQKIIIGRTAIQADGLGPTDISEKFVLNNSGESPPTENGHAPPPIELRKCCLSVHPSLSGPDEFFPCCVKFQLCDRTPSQNPEIVESHKVFKESQS